MPSPLTHDDPAALGPYRLVARLGSGGMGTVYVARSAGGRTLALKTMHAAVAADPAGRTRFRLEIDAARVIGGQFGAKVVDADPYAETPWLATEYVLGPPLDEAVENSGPLTERAVRALGAGLCAALGQLHRSDVVHRDLKPSNIIVTAYGPKVIDFGIARAIGDIHLTHTGSAVGTPAFMSPEQATSQEHTAAGDVFALAGVLVYAARGSGPFGHGQPADLLYRVRYGEPDFSGVPAALVPVLAQCLDKDPARRPSTDQLAAQLHDGRGEFVEHLPPALLGEIGRRAVDVWQIAPQRTAAPPVTPDTTPPASTAARPLGTSRRGFLAAGGAVAVAALAGGGAWWWSSRDTGQGSGKGEAVDKGATEQRFNADPVWEYTRGQLTDDWGPSVPYVTDDVIVVPNGAETYGLRPSDGVQEWKRLTDSRWWQYAVVDNQEYQLSASEHVEHDRQPVGVTFWDKSQKYTRQTPLWFPGTVFEIDGIPEYGQQLVRMDGTTVYAAVGSAKSHDYGFHASDRYTLRAADVRTGKTLWSKPLPRRPDKSTRLHFLAAEVVGKRLVTLQEMDKNAVRIVVRDVASGDVVWERPYAGVKNPRPLRSPLAVDDTHLYIGGDQLIALRLSDGKQMWASEKGTEFSPPTVVSSAGSSAGSSVVYAVGKGYGFAAVDGRSGKLRWKEASPEVSDASTAWCPVIGTRYGYYRNGQLLRAVELTGKHEIGRTYKVTSSTYAYFEDKKHRLVLGVGDTSMRAYPLK
ncbi:PQQ-binding-like beta-propeller repeat protein [Streptomyces sp. SID8379]|uniref:serine/threonine-protein kinase n=1 Tax=unclassified Streptomyces TaxID=2593676 RepID=UPI0003A5744D|nr:MULTISPECIES: protein kinase [unclassified Streptomyces]MYW69564.1 PQQ-binding-like beta-propeller repeat protein [Streptomyces sp. SID8379]